MASKYKLRTMRMIVSNDYGRLDYCSKTSVTTGRVNPFVHIDLEIAMSQKGVLDKNKADHRTP